jgi:catechol 2,3-dioxygenase-like lactoylglutathione lyase family enzyme
MMAEVAGIDHVAILVSDQEKAVVFFRDLLGFKEKFDFVYDGVRIIILKAGKIDLEIWEDRAQAVPECPDAPLQHMGVNHLALAGQPDRAGCREAGAARLSGHQRGVHRHTRHSRSDCPRPGSHRNPAC